MAAPMKHIAKSVIRFSNGLDRLATVMAGVALVILVGAVMLQVLARYVFNQPPAYTEELARYAMIWAGLMGATISFKRRFDPALFTGEGSRNALLGLAAALMRSAVVLIYLLPILWYVFYGPNMNPARGFLLRHSRTMADALPFSTFWVAVAVPIMIVFILVHLAARWCGDDGVPPADSDAT
ncbi:TRAP transporter small permease subunit [Nitratireductor aquibiodomus]|uniref:TRAP transporter small permease n=2 Tax=Phyllobacteriaceae TaxID=69277 RepID=UPI0019D3F643|nr:TRAP transporter small permease subunit [Nitratireductor aquimarinus]MBN7760566.1 TRAP transporter small permease subunit [Nitratireductor aquibiodomus]MCV0349181.1 TRAP transporter small permease subunit [Nitratireductor sp.]MDV2967685.1 TRAP transporter small permease subunit [Nitratireductor aquimarinus]